MSEQYTPTTDEVRNAFNQTSVWLPRTSFKDYGETFDRWLAAHDAKVLRDAADAWAADPDSWGDNEKDYRNELRDRADRIAGGTSHE